MQEVQEQQRAKSIIRNSESSCIHGCFDGTMISEKDGKHISFPCKCEFTRVEREKYRMLLQAADVLDLEHMTFETYEPQNESQAEALKVMGEEHRGFYLFGPWGTGKTHLLTASVLRAIDRGINSVRISVPKLLHRIRKSGRDDRAEIEELAQSIPYLALDDIGKQKDTDWTEERLFMLLDERYKKWLAGECYTSITSNLPLKMLAERMDGATVDRIRGMCTAVLVDGQSYRRGKP